MTQKASIQYWRGGEGFGPVMRAERAEAEVERLRGHIRNISAAWVNPRSLNISGHNITVRDNTWANNKAFVYPGTGTVTGNSGAGTSGACSSYSWSNNNWTQGGCQ